MSVPAKPGLCYSGSTVNVPLAAQTELEQSPPTRSAVVALRRLWLAFACGRAKIGRGGEVEPVKRLLLVVADPS